MTKNVDNNHALILIDDECLLCNRIAQWIGEKDTRDHFRICGLQSEKGKNILSAYQNKQLTKDSIVVLFNDQILIESEAMLFILSRLEAKGPFIFIYKLLPEILQKITYRLVARFRYQILGKANYCSMNSVLRNKIIS